MPLASVGFQLTKPIDQQYNYLGSGVLDFIIISGVEENGWVDCFWIYVLVRYVLMWLANGKNVYTSLEISKGT